LPRPVRFVIHNLAQAESALRAGMERGVAIVLETAPGAGRYWGPAYFLNLVERARAAYPAAQFESVLDCGFATGLAVEALRQGVRAVRIEGHADAIAAITDIASQLGGRIEPAPRPADMIDLSTWRDPLALARRTLAEVQPHREDAER
jgi:hypothetical protein